MPDQKHAPFNVAKLSGTFNHSSQLPPSVMTIRHHALSFCLSMIFPENRYPAFPDHARARPPPPTALQTSTCLRGRAATDKPPRDICTSNQCLAVAGSSQANFTRKIGYRFPAQVPDSARPLRPVTPGSELDAKTVLRSRGDRGRHHPRCRNQPRGRPAAWAGQGQSHHQRALCAGGRRPLDQAHLLLGADAGKAAAFKSS